jgi:hypothetical protein
MFNCKISQCFNVARSREENSSKFPKRMNDGATLQTTAPFHMRVSVTSHLVSVRIKDIG